MFRKHPIVMRKGLIYASIGLLIGPLTTTFLTTSLGTKLFGQQAMPTMGFFYVSLVFSFVIALVLFFPSWMSWYFSVYIITNKRFIQIFHKGFFQKSYSDMPLQQIQSVNYTVKGFQQTVLGFGTILVQTYLGDILMNDMHKPAQLTKEINTILIEQDVHTVQYPAEQEGDES